MNTPTLNRLHVKQMVMGLAAGTVMLAGCAPPRPSSPAQPGGPAAPTAPFAAAPMPPACDTLLNPDIGKLSAATQVIAASGATIHKTFWTLSVNFKEIKANGAPVACFKVYEWDGKNYVPNGQYPHGERKDVCTKVGKVVIGKSSNQTYASPEAQFGPDSYIECETRIADWLGLLVGFGPGDRDKYDAFDLGIAGTLAPATKGVVYTAMLYEPGPKCQNNSTSPSLCAPLAQTLSYNGSEVEFETYLNQPVKPSGGIVTPNAEPNKIMSGSNRCEFDPKNSEEHVWWSHLGPDVVANTTFTETFFHNTYGIDNKTLQMRCDGAPKRNPEAPGDVGTPLSVDMWLGAATLYIGGGPNRDSWEGVIEEIIVDPLDAGAGGG